MRKFSHLSDIYFFILILGVSPLVFFSVAEAQVICKADLAYGVKKEEGSSKILFEVIERRAGTEEEARRAVADSVTRQQSKAFESCQRQHENVSLCFSARFSSFSSTLQGAGFSARKALEDSIKADCEKLRGTCSGTEVSDAVCTGLAPPPTPTEEADSKKGKKK